MFWDATVIRTTLIAFALLATPALAEHHETAEPHEEHTDQEHLAEADGIRAVHAWTNATDGSTGFVYVDLGNASDYSVTLIGAESDIATSAEIVGLENSGGELVYTPIPEMPIAAGSEVVFAPNGLAIRLSGLTAPLVEGESFEIGFEFDGLHLDAVVAIESTSATQHSHAGHQH